MPCQYKDYVLVLLFMKYVSDKYAGRPYQPITIPRGASFADMVALKGDKEIGDKINNKTIAPLVKNNEQLSPSDFPDFNDAAKLGTGKEMVSPSCALPGWLRRKRAFILPILTMRRKPWCPDRNEWEWLAGVWQLR